MVECVLSVDIGTTSLKAGIISVTGEVVFFSKKLFYDNEDRFIAVKWLQSLRSALEGLKTNQKNIKICAISVSGNGPTVVSSGGMTIRWNENYGIEKSRTGTSLFLPNLIAFKEFFNKEYNRSQYLFSGPEYFIYELTGVPVTVLPEKRFIPAYWTDEILTKENVNIAPEKLPPFIEIGKKCGNLCKASAEFLKLEEGIPVFSGGPDFVAALIGTNTLEPGKICDRCGSSEGLNFCVGKLIFTDKIRTLPSVISDLWNCSYLIPSSSKLKHNKRLTGVKEGIEELRKMAGMNNIPFPDKIVVTGGQSKDGELLQKKADALNMKVAVCNCNDAELIGDACVAFYGLGVFNTIKEAAENIVKERVVYNPKVVE